MKKLFFISLLLLVYSLTIYAQSESAIKKLSVLKKKQIAKLMNDIDDGMTIYANSTNDKVIVIATAETIKRIRKLATTIPKGLFRNTLLTVSGAWEKSLWFRYDEIGNAMMSMSARSEIIKIYKLESFAPEDRPTRLFEFAKTFFDMAADIAIDSGIPTN
jgi:hypothetical protein